MTTNKKHTYEYVKDFIEKEGYFLLSENYVNNRTKMKLKCNKEHFFEMCFNSFQSGHRCPTCASIQKNINQKNDYDYVKKYVEKIGFSLIDNNYINNRTKLTIQCEHGHIFKTTFHTFHKNYKCPICDRNKKYTISEISDYLMKYKYELISNNYNNNKDYLTIKCPIGHIFKMKFNTFQQGNRCSKCSIERGGSTPEKEIVTLIKSIYNGYIVENDRTIIKNYFTNRMLELDIWLPDVKKAIEYNGSYWHNNNMMKWKDEIKKKQCIQKGINLLVISSKDWKSNKQFVIEKINSFISS